MARRIPIQGMAIMRKMCVTCPFQEHGSIEVRSNVISRLFEVSQTCHEAHDKRLCRGARDFQLTCFYRIGMIEAPTDEAWEKKRREVGV
jgi:hypothetical protein